MNSETITCQNCKKDFTIESEDFNFYEKIKVPPPTFCPGCRMQRRLTWRNERSLYKRACDLCKKNIISVYKSDVKFPVYCHECWYSDKWDPTSFGRNYDFSKNFFDQFKELYNVIPHLGNWLRSTINSDFSNLNAECKDVYLSTSVVDGSENVFYSRMIDKSFNIFDSYSVKESDSCYENIECEKNYNCQHMFLSKNCLESYFLVDCVNCSNCVLSYNLRNKEFCIRNKQYLKEDYFREIKKMNLGSREAREMFIDEFEEVSQQAIYRFSNMINSNDSTGNNLKNTKNVKNCFDIYESEDLKYCYRGFYLKDCMDFDFGVGSELMYEYNTGAKNDYNVKFSFCALDTVRNADYTDACMSSSNLFGCIGLRNKENVILNKIYSKEEFLNLRERIISQMNLMPFCDKIGRIYKYGEFFPAELSPFAYNETFAQDLFPLLKDQVLGQGYEWRDQEVKNYDITIHPYEIPNDISEVNEEILEEKLGCSDEEKCNHQCLKVFRLTKGEFLFYKKNNIPIPSKCSNCRYYDRFQKILHPKIYNRSCSCEKENHDHVGKCQNAFETSYAPERPEKVYCESCYQKEVY